MIYFSELDLLFAFELPATVQRAVNLTMCVLSDKEKAFIKRQVSKEQLNTLYNVTLGYQLERALLSFYPRDSAMLNTKTGKAVLVIDATNKIIGMLRKQLRNHHFKIGRL